MPVETKSNTPLSIRERNPCALFHLLLLNIFPLFPRYVFRHPPIAATHAGSPRGVAMCALFGRYEVDSEGFLVRSGENRSPLLVCGNSKLVKCIRG